MKKILVLALTTFIASATYAQKIKVKKDVIYLDKEQIGHVEGSLWKAKDDSANIYGKNNELILTIKLNEHNFANPLYKPYKWYDIKFGDSGKELMINHLNATTSSIQSIMSNFSKKFEFVFDGSLIKNQDDIIAKYNFKNELENDIKSKEILDSKYAEILAKNEIDRDRLEPVRFKTIQKDEKILIQEIMQDYISDDKKEGLVIGTLTKEYKINLGSTVINEIEYWFKERFEQPQGEEKLNDYYAAGVIIENSMVVHDCNVYTFVDMKTHKVKIEDPLNAEKTIVKFLLENGYL